MEGSGITVTHPAVRHGVGLPFAMTAVMFGVVFVANPGRYGIPGVFAGVIAIAVGLLATVKLFGRTEVHDPPSDRHRSNHNDGENGT